MPPTEAERKDEPVSQVTATEAVEQLPELLSRVGYGGERFVITRHGRPVAGLVSAEDLKRLTAAAA
jgi:prevent-host-death family protein